MAFIDHLRSELGFGMAANVLTIIICYTLNFHYKLGILSNFNWKLCGLYILSQASMDYQNDCIMDTAPPMFR